MLPQIRWPTPGAKSSGTSRPAFPGGPLTYTTSCHEMPRGYPDVPQIVTEHVVPNTQIVSENVVPNNATYVNRGSSVHQQLDDEFAFADSFL